MNSNHAIAHLDEADASLEQAVGTLETLAENRSRATPLREIVDTMPTLADEVHEAFVRGIVEIVRAQAEHFPDTIFWDVDAMAHSIATGPAAASPESMTALCKDIAELQAQYGRHSILAFRYTHDFTYGYDWAKWVRRAPRKRAEIGPFHPTFVRYLRRRGAELVELIENDDEKYPKLPNGKPRNPFGFRREPSDEAALFRDLAERDLLPVRGWLTDGVPRCDRPFAELREARAVALGIPTKPVGGA